MNISHKGMQWGPTTKYMFYQISCLLPATPPNNLMVKVGAPKDRLDTLNKTTKMDSRTAKGAFKFVFVFKPESVEVSLCGLVDAMCRRIRRVVGTPTRHQNTAVAEQQCGGSKKKRCLALEIA